MFYDAGLRFEFNQGTLTEGEEGSVHFTSSLR